MIYLITGANGTGKTLFMLRWARDLQLEWQKKGTQRTVYYNGMDMVPEIAEQFGWKHFEDPQKWMDLPDNSIVLVDEAQSSFPSRGTASKTPDFEQEIAISHRKRGFDFFIATQHPSNISFFIRNLIGEPGWHRHLKRQMGLNGVLCFQFSYAETNCQKPIKDNSIQRSRRKFPKEVYNWYTSAVMHTGKVHIHKAFYTLIIGLIFLFVVAYYGYARFKDRIVDEPVQDSPRMEQRQERTQNLGLQQSQENRPMTQAEYIDSFRERIKGFPHTSPRYDEVTKPVTAPYPAVCINMESKGCVCYSQQGTKLVVPKDTCLSIVKNGYFVDWDTSPQKQKSEV